jgi:hypothetical protein
MPIQQGEHDKFTVDDWELGSAENDPADVYRTETVSNTVAGTKTINLSGSIFLISDADKPVQAGDKVKIPSGVAAGVYTVATIPTQTSVTVVESILSSTGGTAKFLYGQGAKRVGYNGPIPGSNVYEALNATGAAAAVGIPFLFLSESPSAVLEWLGRRDHGFPPEQKLKMGRVWFGIKKSGGTQKTIRCRVFKWNGLTLSSQLIYKIILTVTAAGHYDASTDVEQTPGAATIDPANGDRVYGRIDDASGSDTDDAAGTQPDAQFSQINVVPGTELVL